MESFQVHTRTGLNGEHPFDWDSDTRSIFAFLFFSIWPRAISTPPLLIDLLVHERGLDLRSFRYELGRVVS